MEKQHIIIAHLMNGVRVKVVDAMRHQPCDTSPDDISSESPVCTSRQHTALATFIALDKIQANRGNMSNFLIKKSPQKGLREPIKCAAVTSAGFRSPSHHGVFTAPQRGCDLRGLP